ncbi:MAG: UDP-N-acetylmuramoyl-tripeptide--D-alanyl-D-alanine ligase [Planctomycetota bacterium]
MKPLTLEGIAQAMHARIARGSGELEAAGVSTDTRTLAPGELFFALVGKNFDGHEFVREAGGKGACAVVVEHPGVVQGPAGVRVVRSTVAALGHLAQAVRGKLSADFVGVTGSCGKTTVKEMIAAVLGTSFKVVHAKKSYNNAIGVPLTILSAPPDAGVVVLEMGTSAPGEIRALAEIARPDVGVVTNVGPTHLEGLKSIEGVAAAKAELIEGLAEGGIAVLNWDDRWVRRMASWGQYRVVSYGRSKDADLRAVNVRLTEEGSAFTVGRTEFAIRVPGKHNVHNALAAIAVALRFRLSIEKVAENLARFELPPMRLERRSAGGVEILCDCYNANLLSVRGAIEELAAPRRRGGAARKVFVFGGMAELGERSAELHARVGRLAARRGIDVLVTVGSEADRAAQAAIQAGMRTSAVHRCEDMNAAGAALRGIVRRGDRVLFKASRTAKLEELVEDLASRLAGCGV